MGSSFIEQSRMDDRLIIPTKSYESSKYEDANGFRNVNLTPNLENGDDQRAKFMQSRGTAAFNITLESPVQDEPPKKKKVSKTGDKFYPTAELADSDD